MMLQNQDAWEGGAQPPNSNPRGLASFITVTNHLRRAIDVEKHLGTKVYLAFGNESQLQNVYDSLQLMKERKVIK